MKKVKSLTSKNGVKMVIANDVDGYAVFTKDEYDQGKVYRYSEFDQIDDYLEAWTQAKNY